MTDKDKIRAEIERRRALNFKRKQGSRSLEDNDILSFIDSLQEDPVSEDERIRKAIADIVKTCTSDSLFNGTKEKCLAWLEKQGEQKLPIEKLSSEMKTIGESLGFTNQEECNKYNQMVTDLIMSDDDNGEQKPVDKVEPKFHEGDWVVSPNGVYWHIDKISNNRYEVTSDTGESSSWNLDTNIYHKFTIQDAKDGDVIYSRHNTESFEWIGIFKSLDKENKRVFFYGFWNNMAKTFSVCRNEAYVLYDDFSPATQEQRDTLMKAMADAGYSFAFEKKELKKIEHNPNPYSGTSFEYNGHTYGMCARDNGVDILIDSKLKTHVSLDTNQKPAWSAEDENMLNHIINDIESLKEQVYCKNLCDEEIDWLKSLKEKVQPQPKQEWNGGDEAHLHSLITHLEQWIERHPNTTGADVQGENVAWLKSLRPQTTWKPSDGQLKVLKEAVDEHWEPDGLDPLYTLYQDLKKLREK